MKLKYTFANMEIDEQITAIPMDAGNRFRGVLHVNQTGAFLLEHLREETTRDKLVEGILREYEGDENTVRNYVDAFLGKLRERNLLEE